MLALFVIAVDAVLVILWLAAARAVGWNNPHPLARRGLVLGGIGLALALAGSCVALVLMWR